MSRRRKIGRVVLACMVASVLGAGASACGEGASPVGSRGSAVTNGTLDSANRFSNVGAMVVEFPAGSGDFMPICTGTLIAPNVFLTASHCTIVADMYQLPVFVTFTPAFAPDSPRIAGTQHTHPAFGVPGNDDPHDIAVITLAQDATAVYPGIVPAALPTANQFHKLFGGAGQKNDPFTAVGYGVFDRTVGHGQPTMEFDGARRVAVSTFNAINKAWLRLSQNASTGNGGTCYGDSGGPNFLGADATLTNVVAGLTVTGDTACRSTNVIYRLDTPAARDFLAPFVALP
ncbi:MAG: trypsin-like serine protease [Deltaproteobacteria bacterium]|nr:trypsin-like serine protease [Deltaproteobacteria bacterium]